MIIKLVKFALFLGLLFAVQFLCRKATDDFAIELIKQPLQQSEASITTDLSAILEQKFHYLGSGGECYCFASEDGEYVLKFFKQHHLRLPSFIAKISPEFLKEKFARKERDLLISCQIAANELSNETGVIYLHLEDERGVPNHIHLIDKLGIAHKVPSHSLPFVLQKRAVPLLQRLQEMSGAQARSAIDSLVDLVRRRCEKGIADADPFLDRNFGFIGEKIVEFDIGPFSYDPMLKYPEHTRREMYFELSAFQRRLCAQYPDLSLYLQDHIDKILHE
jgi:hypothetical protein